MNSLFLKILSWFLLAMTLVVLTVVVSGLVSDSRKGRDGQDALDRTMTPLLADDFAEIYDAQGRETFASFLAHTENGFPFHPYLFDQYGMDTLSRIVPAEAHEVFRLASKSDETIVTNFGKTRWVGQSVDALSGKKYVLVLQFKPAPQRTGILSATSRVQVLRILVVAAIISFVCFTIARHITAPILELRQTANQLAIGNLGARVDPAALRRADELGELSRDFDHMAERIESLLNSQRRLIADISHELRSPLARLSVALGLARRSSSGESVPSLDRIERETERLNEMIGGLLNLAKLETGAEVVRKKFDLKMLVRQIAEDGDFEASGRNRRVQLGSVCECFAEGDSELLHSAIENVVRNAVNYTPEGTSVDVSMAMSPERNAIITVRDHGPGVPSEALKNIFEPFYRVQVARDRDSGGTGLGLSITDRAIRGHGGSVDARNASNGGLIIEICIPTTADGMREIDEESGRTVSIERVS